MSREGIVTPLFGGIESEPLELATQLDFAGHDFGVHGLRNVLGNLGLFNKARGTIQSFVPDLEQRDAIRDTYDGVVFHNQFSPDVDSDDSAETADFRLNVTDEPALDETQVTVNISPNGLKVLYNPVLQILESNITGSPEFSILRDAAVNIAYGGIYSGIIAQYIVKRHALMVDADNASVDDFTKEKINILYGKVFPENGVLDPAVRLNHIASRFGGAVMLRHSARAADSFLEQRGSDGSISVAGNSLKMFVAGLRHSVPRDQQQVSFALVNAFTPSDSANFLRAWFTK